MNEKLNFKKEIVEVEDDIRDVPTKPKSTRLCFNCGKDDHNLRECPKPHNQLRIAKNRAQFANSRGTKAAEFTRYHKEIDDRFSGFRPGKLSFKLREALGLKKDTLPRYIYNMRRLGYPPGWLEEAKISHSGINMLDSNGERVPDPDEEEGEICSVRVKYDISRIIDYPGFNVWPDPGTINETEAYGSLPMCYDQSKEAFIARLNDSSFNYEQTIDLVGVPFNSEEEMDIEEIDSDIRFDTDQNSKFGFIPPLPDENVPTPPPPPPEDLPPPPLDECSNDNETCTENCDDGTKSEEISSEEEEGELPSKSSSKIHRTKSLSKKAIDKSNCLLLTSKEIEPKEVSTPSELNQTNDSLKTVENPDSQSLNEPKTSNNMETNQGFGRIKSVEFGTPVLNHSPYTALPAPEKFRKDISDVIYFENLPNSTGKYERLKGVLKSVRTKLNVLRGGEMKK
ncbi:hypothetical protein O3M35_010711 [Rhynocoris fuscipes]|uniref:CCHC-type domain-containing protein n=1 Tax=Rhynocoris fuscipes TaxID=488301 RepID=A0AAW1D7N3_9HEMI